MGYNGITEPAIANRTQQYATNRWILESLFLSRTYTIIQLNIQLINIYIKSKTRDINRLPQSQRPHNEDIQSYQTRFLDGLVVVGRQKGLLM
jgi:hypothetical protein